MKKEKKCIFDKSCKIFSEMATTITNEEYSVLNEFYLFEKFVDDVVSFFNSYFCDEDLRFMCSTIVNFIKNNQNLFGFSTVYPYVMYVNLVKKSLDKVL